MLVATTFWVESNTTCTYVHTCTIHIMHLLAMYYLVFKFESVGALYCYDEYRVSFQRIEFYRYGRNWMLALKITGRVSIIRIRGSINSQVEYLQWDSDHSWFCTTTVPLWYYHPLHNIVIFLYTLSLPSPLPPPHTHTHTHRWSFTPTTWHLSRSVWWPSWLSSTLSSTCSRSSLSFPPPCPRLRM